MVFRRRLARMEPPGRTLTEFLRGLHSLAKITYPEEVHENRAHPVLSGVLDENHSQVFISGEDSGWRSDNRMNF